MSKHHEKKTSKLQFKKQHSDAENSFTAQIETIWTITTLPIILKLLDKCLQEATIKYKKKTLEIWRSTLI